MRVLMLCLAISLTAACSTSPVIPDLTTGVITTDKPIPTRCVNISEFPIAPKAPPIATDADPEQRAAWAKLRDSQLRQYIKELRATLLACAGDQ